jgi:hypothetical protein
MEPVSPTPDPSQAGSSRKKMLGEYLIELGFVGRAQLDEALAEQNAGKHPGLRVGDILQHKGLITRAQLDQAIECQMLDCME